MTPQSDHKWLSLLPFFVKRRIEGRHNLQMILGNTGWMLFDKLLRMCVGLFVIVWIARYLGPDQFGAFNFAVAFTSIFGYLASLGLDGIVVKYLVREPDRKFEILSTAFVLKLCGGVSALLISLISIIVIRPLDIQVHWLVGIIAASMIFQAFDTIDLWFQSQMQSKYTVLAKNSAYLLIALVKVSLILKSAPLIAFAYASLAEVVLGAVGLLLIYLKHQSEVVWCPRMATALRFIGESWPAILSGLAIMIYMRIDQIMLAQMVGNHEVGLYSAALRFSEIWYFIPTIIVNSVMPILTRIRQESNDIYLQRIQQLLNNLARIAYTIALPMALISKLLITSLYGQEYSAAGTILAIHIWASVFIFIGMGINPWLINENLLKYSLFQTVSGVIVNISLNILLIPKYGGIGAATATVIAQVVASFASNIVLPKMRVIFKMQLRALLRPF